MPANPDHITARLRFSPRDARKLRTAATLTPYGDDLGLFHKAAESAEADEPLIVHCTQEELRHMTDRLQHFGFNHSTDAAPNRR